MVINYKFCAYIILLTLLIANCTKLNGDKKIESFPLTTSLSSKPVKDIKIIASWGNLVVIDTFLIVQKRKSNFIHIYSTNNHKLLGKIGEKGNGPNEFIMPNLVKAIAHDPKNNSPVIILYDLIRRRLSKVNILKAINGETDAILQEQIKALDDVLVRLYHKDDSLLLASPEKGGRFIIHSYTNSETKYIPFVPALELDIKISDYNKELWYTSYVVVNKEKKRFVAANQYLNELNFFDLQGNYIKSTIIEPRSDVYKKLKPKKPDGLIGPDAKSYFTHLEQIDNKIYVLYENNKIANIGVNGPPYKIQVFDWDGNPIEEFVLEGNKRIGSIAFDKIHQQFYVYLPDEEDNNLIIYPINEF